MDIKGAVANFIAISFSVFAVLVISFFTYIFFTKYTPQQKALEQGVVSGAKSQKVDLLYPNSQILSKNERIDGETIALKTSDTVGQILAYYSKTLSLGGWEKITSFEYRQQDKKIIVSLTSETDNSIIVTTDYSFVPTR